MPTREHARLRTNYGPWAVVTGASSGIGREVAVLLAEAWLNLVLVARTQASLDQLARDLKGNHAIDVRVLPLDLAAESAAAAVTDATSDLDVGLLVAAAGFGTSGPFLSTPDDAEYEMLAVNCRAVVGLSREFARSSSPAGGAGWCCLARSSASRGCRTPPTTPPPRRTFNRSARRWRWS